MVYITWLANQLRADGYIPVIETSGWKTRTRPGSYNPVAVLLHHTGATTSYSNPAPSVGVVINGRSDLPGPLCAVHVDYRGNCRVIAAGRTNNAGTALASGPVPGGDGNTMYVGIEMDYNGTQLPANDQYANTVNAAAAILFRLGKPASWTRGHKETSTTGKWDPGAGPTMAEYRSMIKAWGEHRWGPGFSSARAAQASTFSEKSLPMTLDELRQEILINGAANMDAINAELDRAWAKTS